MTDSRETMRRKAYQNRAPSADPSPLAVPPTTLCLIPGCLCRRHGANLCPTHQHPDTPKADRCHQI
jgi:hypothetical protein